MHRPRDVRGPDNRDRPEKGPADPGAVHLKNDDRSSGEGFTAPAGRPILSVMLRVAKSALLAIVLVAFGALALGPATATQNDPRLAPLFERLKSSENPQDAQLVEVLIWQVWAESGDAATDSLMALGVQTMQMGNFPGALELFDAVTTRKPDFAEGWNKRATILYLMGAYEASARDVDKTLALEPRHFGALSGLGLINMALERDEAAITAFESALKIHPYLPGVKVNLETLRKRASQRGRAI